VQPIDQMALMVGLAKVDIEPQRLRLIVEAARNIVKRIGPVNLRLAHSEQVEVGAVEDVDEGAIGQRNLA
jgi:hypothetical protein